MDILHQTLSEHSPLVIINKCFFFFLQSFSYLPQKPLMLNVSIEAENSRLKVCYSSEIG